jgi:hypothetical protein
MENKLDNNETEELLEEGIKVIEIPAKNFGTRKIFQNLKPQHINFIPGKRVLPAPYIGIPDQGAIYFKKYHAPGEIGYLDGAYECYSEGGGIYNFYLDALMIHPSEMKRSETPEILGLKRRGRPSDPSKPKKEIDYTKPKKGRGRPRMNPEDKKVVKVYEKKGTKRGRKPLPPEMKLQKEQEKQEKNIKSGGKRGRPSIPEHLKKPPKEKKYTKRGRPSTKNLIKDEGNK